MSEQDPRDRKRRRSIIRTALVLAGVVIVIYLLFIGQGFWNYYTS